MDLFGLKRRRYWNEVFSNCDLEFAADLLIRTFAGGIIPKELAKLLNAYTNNPCRETAIELIEFDKNEFLRFFVDNKIMLESMMKTKALNREDLSKTLRKNKNVLREEPEFKAYCEAYLENDPDKVRAMTKKEKAILIKKGYSEEMISEAFSEYMADAAFSDDPF